MNGIYNLPKVNPVWEKLRKIMYFFGYDYTGYETKISENFERWLIEDGKFTIFKDLDYDFPRDGEPKIDHDQNQEQASTTQVKQK